MAGLGWMAEQWMTVVQDLGSLSWGTVAPAAGEASVAMVVGVCEVSMAGLGWMVDHWMWSTGGSDGQVWDVVVVEDSVEATARHETA